MTRTLDLNAKRSERAAARGEPLMVTLNGETFTLVDELPVEVAHLAGTGDFDRVLGILVVPEDRDRFRAAGPSMNDLLDIIAFYGAELGESSASIVSSVSTGAPSRQTSAASTG